MNDQGFTLIELLVVVLILGALSFVAIPRVTENARNSKQRTCETNIGILNTQIELFKTRTGSYLADLTVLTNNENYFPEGMPVCPLDGTYYLSEQNRALCTHSNPPACGALP